MPVLLAKVIATLLLVALCTYAAFAILYRFENPVNTFATYAEMEASGFMQSGWMPKFIPRSAYQIAETHNLDTNVVEVTFRFEPGDTEVAKAQCQLLRTQDTNQIFRCPRGQLQLSSDGSGFYRDGLEATE